MGSAAGEWAAVVAALGVLGRAIVPVGLTGYFAWLRREPGTVSVVVAWATSTRRRTTGG